MLALTSEYVIVITSDQYVELQKKLLIFKNILVEHFNKYSHITFTVDDNNM